MRFWFLFCWVLLSAIGCASDRVSQSEAHYKQATASLLPAQERKVVTGMTENQVRAQLGQPKKAAALTSRQACWTYEIASSSGQIWNQDVYFEDGKVIKVEYQYRYPAGQLEVSPYTPFP